MENETEEIQIVWEKINSSTDDSEVDSRQLVCLVESDDEEMEEDFKEESKRYVELRIADNDQLAFLDLLRQSFDSWQERKRREVHLTRFDFCAKEISATFANNMSRPMRQIRPDKYNKHIPWTKEMDLQLVKGAAMELYGGVSPNGATSLKKVIDNASTLMHVKTVKAARHRLQGFAAIITGATDRWTRSSGTRRICQKIIIIFRWQRIVPGR